MNVFFGSTHISRGALHGRYRGLGTKVGLVPFRSSQSVGETHSTSAFHAPVVQAVPGEQGLPGGSGTGAESKR